MWDNIGHKLQSLAKVICWIGIIGSFIWGIVTMLSSNQDQPDFFMGILNIVLGCLGSWIGSWSIYGLGLVVEYVENGGGKSSYTDTSAGFAFHGTKTSDGGTLTAGSYWTCPDCKARNPMSKIECKECGKIR